MKEALSRRGKNIWSRADDPSSFERRRTRTDWAGVGLGDAFRFGNDYRVRLSAVSLLTNAIKAAQRDVASYTGVSPQSSELPRVLPQLSPCYTTYPARMAACAAIGLTAFLEYRELASDRLLELDLKEYLENPAASDGLAISPSVYKELVQRVTKCVQTRLLLEDLSRAPGLNAVEAYRLFAAAHSNRISFASVVDIVQAIVLYGELLPTQVADIGHPVARVLVKDIYATSQPYLQSLSTTPSERLLEFGSDWTRSLCVSLARTLKKAYELEAGKSMYHSDLSRSVPIKNGLESEAVEPKHAGPRSAVSPLNAPRRPSLFDSHDIGSLLGRESSQSMTEEEKDLQALRKHLGEEAEEELRARAFDEFSKAVAMAAGQQPKWEDIRSDLIAILINASAFERGPIEGNPAEGHLVSVRFGESEVMTGEQFDCTVDLSEDLLAHTALLNVSKPTIDTISRILYPSIERIPDMQRVCTSGSLDPARLALGEITSAIYRRSRMTPQPNRRGKALLVIACDGSGSLNSSQMRMLKILTCSWLMATARSEVQVLAGLYHSGSVRSGLTGPLVQWIAHPRLTRAVSNTDAVRALITLPDTGTGVQSDALSLAFIMEEARKLTNGTIYFIHMTDCKWNRSFAADMSGEEEVRSLMQSWRTDSQPIHLTMVALGVSSQTGLEPLVDNTVPLTDQDLRDATAVADKIGRYVATCITERRQLLAS